MKLSHIPWFLWIGGILGALDGAFIITAPKLVYTFSGLGAISASACHFRDVGSFWLATEPLSTGSAYSYHLLGL